MNELIEKYLDVRIRYYRGYRDDVYFFMVDIGDHARLHVHLEVSGADRDGVQISITPDWYYPAAYSDRILQALARWNSDCRAIGALLQESSDLNLVGVAAGSVYRGVDPAEFGASSTAASPPPLNSSGRSALWCRRSRRATARRRLNHLLREANSGRAR